MLEKRSASISSDTKDFEDWANFANVSKLNPLELFALIRLCIADYLACGRLLGYKDIILEFASKEFEDFTDFESANKLIFLQRTLDFCLSSLMILQILKLVADLYVMRIRF